MNQKKFKYKKSAAFSFLGICLVLGFVLVNTKKHANADLQIKGSEKDTPAVGQQTIGGQTASASTASETISHEAAAANVVQIPTEVRAPQYPLHTNIATTYFWAGEEAGKDNKNISNLPSAWDDDWVRHFGGVDDPKKRSNFVVATFVPKENSFYFALPYNDFGDNGKRKSDAAKIIPWANSKQWADQESMLKNQWIKITKGSKTAYAQWEDVGPFGEDDSAYVFGGAKPKQKTNDDAGLDVSPAVRDYLGLDDIDKTNWQFVDASQVPDGPWKKTITTSQIFWN